VVVVEGIACSAASLIAMAGTVDIRFSRDNTLFFAVRTKPGQAAVAQPDLKFNDTVCDVVELPGLTTTGAPIRKRKTSLKLEAEPLAPHLKCW
jgi:hypothetical protein